MGKIAKMFSLGKMVARGLHTHGETHPPSLKYLINNRIMHNKISSKESERDRRFIQLSCSFRYQNKTYI